MCIAECESMAKNVEPWWSRTDHSKAWQNMPVLESGRVLVDYSLVPRPKVRPPVCSWVFRTEM